MRLALPKLFPTESATGGAGAGQDAETLAALLAQTDGQGYDVVIEAVGRPATTATGRSSVGKTSHAPLSAASRKTAASVVGEQRNVTEPSGWATNPPLT